MPLPFIHLSPDDPRTASELARDLGLDGWLKLRDADYCQVPPGSGLIYHLNAMPCSHRLGQRLGLVRIARAGTVETPPEVDFSAIQVLRCEATRVLPACSFIESELYPQLIGRFSDLEVLARRMVERYGVLRNWTFEDALRRPVMLAGFAR